MTCNRWSNDDIERLKEMWNDKDKWAIKDIAKNLDRSEEAVTTKANRLKLGKRYHYSYLTSTDVMDIFGITQKTLSRWRKYGLKSKKSPLDKGEYCYTEKDIMAFLEKHQRHYDSQKLKIEMLSFRPKWLNEKREIDANNKKPINYTKKWTVADDERLKSLLGQGFSNKEIAQKMGRTFSAIEAKIGELNLGYKRKTYWNMKEIIYVKNNSPYKTIYEMSEHIDRTPSAIEAICKEYNFEYHKSKSKCKKEPNL